MKNRPRTVVWISFFPVEWLLDAPEEVRRSPRHHPASWQRTLLAELEKTPGLKLHVFAIQNTFERDLIFERHGVVFHLIKTRAGMRAPTLFWYESLRLRRELRVIQPDLVHAWGGETAAPLVASRLGYPWLATVQGLLVWLSELMPLTPRERLLTLLEGVALRRARMVTAESTFSAGYIRRWLPGSDVRHIDLVPDRLFHQVVRRPQLNPRRFVFIAHLGTRKGGDLLLRALDQLGPELPFELLVIGGAEEAFLRRMKAQTCGRLWAHVQFRKCLSSPEIAEELSRATLMLCPTLADTGPLCVKEAVVAGVPVVASAVGGIPDYVLPGENGVLFPVGNLDGFVQAIRSACDHPDFGQGRVSETSLKRMRDYLSPESMGKRFLEAYEAVLKHFQSSPRTQPRRTA